VGFPGRIEVTSIRDAVTIEHAARDHGGSQELAEPISVRRGTRRECAAPSSHAVCSFRFARHRDFGNRIRCGTYRDPSGTQKPVQVVNLLSVEGLHRVLTTLVTNFTSFAPLGTVLVALLGIGIAEGSGLIGAALRVVVLGAPRQF
jgi:hypothetical protein